MDVIRDARRDAPRSSSCAVAAGTRAQALGGVRVEPLARRAALARAREPPDVAGVFEHTHWDFHAPLFFVGAPLRVAGPRARRRCGSSRSSSNLLVLVPLLAFARRSRLGAVGARALAAALFAFLPFQILYATELRPYAWLMLASAAACCAAFTDAGSKPHVRFVLFAAAVAFGLLTHYLMAVVVLLIGATRAAVPAAAAPPKADSAGPDASLGFWLADPRGRARRLRVPPLAPRLDVLGRRRRRRSSCRPRPPSRPSPRRTGPTSSRRRSRRSCR